MRINHRYILGFMAFLLALILQTTVLKHIAIFGYSPNLILCLVVVCTFLYDEQIGMIYGIVFGLILDLFTNLYIGPSAIAFVVVCLFVRLMRIIFNHERLLPELLLALVSTPLYTFVLWGLLKMTGSPMSVLVVLKAMPVLILYNGIIIIILHLLLVRGVIKHRKDKNISGRYELRNGIKI